MKFQMWSIWHILMITAPFAITAIMYYSVRNRSQKVKDTVSFVLGCVSIMILVVRNIDITINYTDYFEVIPFQLCHMGNIVAGLGLITKKRWLSLLSFCFYLLPAYCAIVFAGALSRDFETIWQLRPQTYIWGHIIIVVCALFDIFVNRPKATKKDVKICAGFIGACSLNGLIFNSVFRALFEGWNPNYYFMYNADYTPFGFVYDLTAPSKYGWFEVNWVYVAFILLLFAANFALMYQVYNRITKKSKAKTPVAVK